MWKKSGYEGTSKQNRALGGVHDRAGPIAVSVVYAGAADLIRGYEAQ